MIGAKYIAKAVCKFCGDEFEYEETEGLFGSRPLRNFCGDFVTGTEWPRCKKSDFPESYKSYIWLCKIYGDTWREDLISFHDDWMPHYQELSFRYDKEAREYYS